MKNKENGFSFSMYLESGDGRLILSDKDSDTMEIIEVLEGEVAIRIGTELIYAVAGDYIYIPPKLVHRVDAIDGRASIRGVVFDSSIFEYNMDNFDTEILYMFYLQSKNTVAPFKSGHPVYLTLKKCMQEAYDEYVSKDVCYRLPVLANIYLMMSALLRYFCGSKDESDRAVYHNVLRLRPVIEYIAEHYCEKIYIEKLADMITVSPDYFTKMFKDSIGKTPIEYINGLKINKAMQILSNTEDSIADISDEIGFCNPNYFHKIFKQYIDMSPLAYRKSSK